VRGPKLPATWLILLLLAFGVLLGFALSGSVVAAVVVFLLLLVIAGYLLLREKRDRAVGRS
jgi:prepilin signal peptidase PulO-like enzyme (type II secretory pathway)